MSVLKRLFFFRNYSVEPKGTRVCGKVAQLVGVKLARLHRDAIGESTALLNGERIAPLFAVIA